VTTPERQVTDAVGVELAAAASVQLGLLLALWVMINLRPVGWLAALLYTTVILALLGWAAYRSSAGALGLANRVTLARAILVGGVTALVVDAVGGHRHVVVLVALSSVALVLDAVDGRVARRTGTVTRLGARFDMEVDAFLILVLSVAVASTVGLWVLAIGAMRYAFVVAGRAVPSLRAPLPTSTARKTVAAIQGVVLVVAASGLPPAWLTTALVGAALALLTWSFGRDVVWLWRAGRQPSAQR
jgi:phosphatidylglycerophosphate synthase